MQSPKRDTKQDRILGLNVDAACLDDLVSLARSDPRRFRAILKEYQDRRSATLAEGLKEEADRYWLIDVGTSLRLARAMVVLGRLMAETRIVAVGAMARADTLRLLGEPRLALRLADSAAARYRSGGDTLRSGYRRPGAYAAAYDAGDAARFSLRRACGDHLYECAAAGPRRSSSWSCARSRVPCSII